MIKTKKRFLAIIIVLLGIILLSLLMGLFSMSILVSAETDYYSAERYTASDQLLQSDGTESSKDINDFSYTVKSGYNGQSFPELAQVVPLEYLETTETNAEFSYNGKEYGFYIAKEGNYFDILLIDFIYEFEDENHTNNEYKIRIEPILQQRFNRTGTAGDYQWEKTANHYSRNLNNIS